MIPGFAPPQTPLLALRRSALDHNLATMQSRCDKAGVRLRAHGKTHKCSTLGRLQVAGGAVGLCAQTVGEAEAFVRGGIRDVLVTAPHPAWGSARLADLARMPSRASGTPVLAAGNSSLREVGGRAALYCHAESVHDIAEKLERLWDDEPLRQELVERGVHQLRNFSWDTCAQETLDYIRN